MDFSFSEQQNMIRDQARRFLEKEVTVDFVHQLEEDERGFSPKIWQKMAALGWLGITFPEEYGGLGLGFLEIGIILEEMGRVLLPSPYISTVILGGAPILYYGSEMQKARILSNIASGELILTMALNEHRSWWGNDNIKTETIVKDDKYSVSGTKLFVPYANMCDFILCLSRTEEGSINLLCINKVSSGIQINPLNALSPGKQWEVIFNGVRVSRKDIIGKVNQGREIVVKTMEFAAAAESAFMLGGAQKALEMTVKYAKERIQFGRPIGSFQVIQHRVAEMKACIEGMRYAVYQAAWRLSEGLSSQMEVSIAKGWAGQAYQRVCADAMQIHGAMGLTKEYPLELYYRQAKGSDIFFGDSNFHKEIIAKEMGF